MSPNDSEPAQGPPLDLNALIVRYPDWDKWHVERDDIEKDPLLGKSLTGEAVALMTARWWMWEAHRLGDSRKG